MSDGAHGGVRAAAAMAKVIVGREIPDSEISDLNAARDRIMATTWAMVDGAEGEEGYNLAADYAARIMYEHFMADPENARKDEPEFYERLMQSPEWKQLQGRYGLSGFQYGWAMNLARALVELPPLPNPAIFTIEVPDA